MTGEQREAIEDQALALTQVSTLLDAVMVQMELHPFASDMLGGLQRLVHGVRDRLDQLLK
jgi:hypothetical protein